MLGVTLKDCSEDSNVRLREKAIAIPLKSCQKRDHEISEITDTKKKKKKKIPIKTGIKTNPTQTPKKSRKFPGSRKNPTTLSRCLSDLGEFRRNPHCDFFSTRT